MLLREDRDLTSQDPVGLEDLAQKRMAELSGYIRTLEQSGEGVARDFAWSSASFTIPNVIMIGYKP